MTDRRYTDRDVRENPLLAELAGQYLEAYQGEFPFLADCKARLAVDGKLSTPLVRGVLNCMRADARVQGMPEPLEQAVDLGAEAKPARTRKHRRAPECTREDIHSNHYVEDSRYAYRGVCPGKYELNRENYSRPAVFKGLVIGAKAGKLHRPITEREAALQAMQRSWVEWRVNPHEPGFLQDPILSVRPACLKPYIVRVHVSAGTLGKALELLSVPLPNKKPRELCKRCFPDGMSSLFE